MKFPPFNPFFEEFNGKVALMVSSGVIERWYRDFFALSHVKRIADEIGPEVLTMEHLDIGFVVCLIPMGLSVLVFICELVVYHGKMLIQKIMIT